jgi:hypothetical protein
MPTINSLKSSVPIRRWQPVNSTLTIFELELVKRSLTHLIHRTANTEIKGILVTALAQTSRFMTHAQFDDLTQVRHLSNPQRPDRKAA